MSSPNLNLGHPQDRNLQTLQLIEQELQAELEFQLQISARDRREIDLAQCFPEGKLALPGRLEGFHKTIDPEVVRCYLVQDGQRKGILYINRLRKKCVAVGCFT